MSKRRRSKSISAVPVMADIEKFSHDGRGIARIDGKTTFISGALPQESVSFQYSAKKRDYDEGIVLSVTTASPKRVEPRCSHASLCGGCSLQHLEASAQIHEKQALLLDILARVGHCQPVHILPPLTSSLWNYRNKARLSVRYVEKKQAMLVGFREKKNPRYITEINECPILNARVEAQLSNLAKLVDGFNNKHCIAQIEVAAGDDDVALIFRNLEPLCSADEDLLRIFAKESQFRIFLQPSGPDSVYLFYPESIDEYLNYKLPEYGLDFKFHPTDFTQVNSSLNRLMIKQALNLLELNSNDVVLDLFCGLGNFSLPLAQKSAYVVGVEGSDAMVLRASMNARDNGINNIEFSCANLESESALETLLKHSFTKLLLDPPRLGAFNIVKQIDKLNPERIVYVSCNPATLARDADVLVNTHGYRLHAAGVMDMFPHTSHVESIALFIRD